MSLFLRLASGETGFKRRVEGEREAFSAGATQEPPPVPIGRNRSVLVVDDNPVVLKAFELKLASCGFKVTTTTNSAAVASSAEAAQAELIILDINFPSSGAMEWNGFTVMQWLRRFPELGRIPVILISGSDSAQYQQQALNAGAVAFFQKPINFPELLATMDRAMAPG